MASDVLASQNESSWGRMGKIPYSNPHLNSHPISNPKKKQKQFHYAAANDGAGGRYQNKVDIPAAEPTASDDAYSFNHTSTSRNAVNYGAHMTYNVASYTKSELRELRKRLAVELEQIRDLRDRIDSGQLGSFVNIGKPRSQTKLKTNSKNFRPISAIGSVPKKLSNGVDNGGFSSLNVEALMKDCRQVLTKLMKNKYAFVFKTPVDAVALGLHDYHQIVKNPMDLGTVKGNLAKNLYPTPFEFADDMRLTFNNALLYNPKTDPVHGMAAEMLARFEELYRPIKEKMDSSGVDRRMEMEFHDFRGNDERQFRVNGELQGSSWSNHNQNLASPLRGKKSKPKMSPVPVPQFTKKPERMQMSMQAHSSASTPSHPPPSMNNLPLEEQIPSPVRAHSLPIKEQKGGRGSGGTMKQPKPKAKGPNKRDMSMEEKEKLGLGLQSLPQEKMCLLVEIIKKRNGHLVQDGDEIELDIEAIDPDTLWELDQFVTDCKKSVSKNNPAAAGAAPASPVAESDLDGMSDKNNDDPVKKLKENDDEDVDIDDDMPATNFPPVEIEKDEGAGAIGGGGQDHDSSSSSGSSSSDSSSSSGTDSDSDSDSSCVTTMC